MSGDHTRALWLFSRGAFIRYWCKSAMFRGQHRALTSTRTGTRLYEAFLNKCQTRTGEAHSLPLDTLHMFRDEEARHFGLIWDVMRHLGGDPTAQTPCADTSGVASMGLLQIMTTTGGSC
jgi:hypothetical protein